MTGRHRFAAATVGVFAAIASAPALATTGFTGDLAPLHWTTTTSGPAFGSLVDANGAPNSITMVGGNDGTGGGCPDGTVSGFVGSCHIDFTIAGNRTYSFNWSYATADQTPQYDQFGMIVDGVRTELVANGGDVFQAGTMTVHANSSFGWYINCTDCSFGGATATLSNISAVPEPGSLALLACGLPLLWIARRRPAR